MGPWFHSQINREDGAGAAVWDTDTTEQWRRDVLLPFFNQYLKPGAPKADTPPVLDLQHGRGSLGSPKVWPLSCERIAR
jgi:predicted acyl esterase